MYLVILNGAKWVECLFGVRDGFVIYESRPLLWMAICVVARSSNSLIATS